MVTYVTGGTLVVYKNINICSFSKKHGPFPREMILYIGTDVILCKSGLLGIQK